MVGSFLPYKNRFPVVECYGGTVKIDGYAIIEFGTLA